MLNSRLKIAFPLVCVLLIAAFVAPVWAAEYNPGVSVGQWIKYGNYVVTTPAEAITSPDWAMMEVIGISGKEATLRITGAFMNGAAIPSSQVICNIEAGRINEWQRYSIAANLNQGDKILNLGVSDTINKTETRTILGSSRSVNILNFTSSYAGQNIRATYIYDKASGMHLGVETEITIIEPAVTYTNSYSIIDTNIFDTPDQPQDQTSQDQTIPVEWIVLIAIIVFAIIVGALLMRRKKDIRKSRKQEGSKESER